MHDKYQRQKRVSNENRDKILTIIQGRKKTDPKEIVIDGATFTEIQKETLLSPAGLTKILQRLETEDTIEKILIKKEIVLKEEEVLIGKGGAEVKPAKKFTKGMKPVYILTEKGQAYYKGIWQLMYELLELKDKNASYMHSLSSNYYNFGLSLDIVMSGKDRQLTFMLPPVPQIEDFIMAETFRNIREKGLKLESSEGKILTSFEIDLSRFADTLIKIQSFIEDINSDKDVFSDSKLDFDKAEVNKLWHFDFLIQFSYILGDDSFRRNLENFLKSFSKNQKFYDLTQVNSELFNRFVKTLEQNKDPLKDKLLFKSLIVPIEKGIGYYNIFSVYIKAAKIIKYGDMDFYKKLDDLDKAVSKKTSEMSMAWSMREQKKFEAKQKRDAK